MARVLVMIWDIISSKLIYTHTHMNSYNMPSVLHLFTDTLGFENYLRCFLTKAQLCAFRNNSSNITARLPTRKDLPYFRSLV